MCIKLYRRKEVLVLVQIKCGFHTLERAQAKSSLVVAVEVVVLMLSCNCLILFLSFLLAMLSNCHSSSAIYVVNWRRFISLCPRICFLISVLLFFLFVLCILIT